VDGQSGELVCRQASGHHQEMVRGWRLKPGEGIAGWVALSGESVILPEVSKSAQHYKGVDRLTGQETNSVLAVPICSKGKVLGVLQLIDERIGRFDQVDQDLVEALASTAAIAIENAHLFDEVQQLSITDQLTGLYNRRGFSNLANQQLKLSERVGMPLTLIFIDIDNMKWINDGQGHLQGDQALLATAQILEESFRDADLKARLGGDEFVVLALNAPLESQGALKARLNSHLVMYNAREDSPFQLSFSIGMASLDPEAPFTLEELISRADAAMYAEKTVKKKLL
jgi:diguanylate cyclase (GGDEF)-like protein